MQKGFNALKDQLKTVPDDMTGFFADCAKNMAMQETITKELYSKGPGSFLNA